MARYLFTLSMSYYNLGKFEETRDTLARVLSLEPSLAQAHFLMAHSFSSSGDRERALPYYEEAMRLDPDNPLYHFQLGLVLGQLGRKDQATIELQRSLALDGTHAPALFELARIYFGDSKLDEAQGLLEHAIEANPDFESSYYLLSQVMQKGRTAEARAMLEQFKQVQDRIRERMKQLKAQDFPKDQP